MYTPLPKNELKISEREKMAEKQNLKQNMDCIIKNSYRMKNWFFIKRKNLNRMKKNLDPIKWKMLNRMQKPVHHWKENSDPSRTKKITRYC